MKYLLPKEYLSYSALDLWYKDPKTFRDRYYLGVKTPDTAYTLFGREVHERIQNDPSLAHIPRLSEFERKITYTFKGIPLVAYIDTFDEDSLSFYDFKTGINTKNGKSRWNDVEVAKSKQLPFYSFLLKKKFGKVNRETKIVFLESAWEEERLNKGGVVLTLSRNLILTGHHKVFDRTIYEWERKNIAKWIEDGVKQISEDYRRWIKN